MLTEKEKMQRAKMYMLKLADGINPIDDSKPENDSIISNERLSRCFAYVAEVLDSAIASNSPVKHISKARKTDFRITAEQLESVAISPKDIAISELVSEINNTVNNPSMKKLQAKTVNDWLVKQGYLRDNLDFAGRNHRELTEKSADIGITSKQGIGIYGEYTIILYSETAQRFIIKNMSNILEES